MRFWSDPDTEIKLAKDTNVTVFRMGVDWSRIMPVEPLNGVTSAVSETEPNTHHHQKIFFSFTRHNIPSHKTKSHDHPEVTLVPLAGKLESREEVQGYHWESS